MIVLHGQNTTSPIFVVRDERYLELLSLPGRVLNQFRGINDNDRNRRETSREGKYQSKAQSIESCPPWTIIVSIAC